MSRTSLASAQIGLPDRDDDRPVTADRAALDPPPPEPDRLQRRTGDPERGEEMAPPAANDGISPDPIAEHARNHGSDDIDRDDRDESPAPERAHSRSMHLLVESALTWEPCGCAPIERSHLAGRGSP